jgi:uncharacterized protein (TIGR02246 family)
MFEFNMIAAKAEIDKTNKKLMASVAAGDSSGIANLYTIDAKLMFTGKPAIVGRENIQAAFSEILKSGVSKIELKTQEIFGAGDLVAEEGEVTVYVNGNAVAEEKYIILWKREDGEWKLFRDIANSNRK